MFQLAQKVPTFQPTPDPRSLMAPTLDVVSHVQLFPWSGIKHPSAPSDQLNPLKCLRVADCARIGTVITGLMRNSENEANGWHIFAVSARGERRVAAACARARELQVGARRQKLALLDFASTQCQLAALCILLLRWALVARSYRLSSRLKEWGHVAASRHAARQEAQLLHICLAAFAAEVSEARRGRIYTDMTCQIHAAVANCDQFFQRLVLKRCQAGRVVSRLHGAAQLRHLRSAFAAWSCVPYRRRRLRESMAKLSTHLEAAAAAELMAVALAGWSWKAKEEKAVRRGVRSLARGAKVILRLRRQLLLLEAFRGWQHARCYEEVFQMLTASQADLANAAEAVALAEAAAAAASRSQQVTVRVLPTPLPQTASLVEVRREIERRLRVGGVSLFSADGRPLAGAGSLENAGVTDGATLSATIDPARIIGHRETPAFALLRVDGSVVTWGSPDYGGDSSAVQPQLVQVSQIRSSHGAFAAICGDGRVVTWGASHLGGQSSSVQHLLQGVRQLEASHGAFAAILDNGGVVTWGDSDVGGDSSHVQDQLFEVTTIAATFGAFAALRMDGRVVTWGDPFYSSDSSMVQDKLVNVCQIKASGRSFAAVLGDGSVVAWDRRKLQSCGGDCRDVEDLLKGVRFIAATDQAFAALRCDARVVTWGNKRYGAEGRLFEYRLQDVLHILGSDRAFAALLKNGRVLAWGDPKYGGDTRFVRDELQDCSRHDGCSICASDVVQIASSSAAFAAVRGDGTVVTWGDPEAGGDSLPVQAKLRQVQHVTGSFQAFAAMLVDGQVVTWGSAESGGDCGDLQLFAHGQNHDASTSDQPLDAGSEYAEGGPIGASRPVVQVGNFLCAFGLPAEGHRAALWAAGRPARISPAVTPTVSPAIGECAASVRIQRDGRYGPSKRLHLRGPLLRRGHRIRPVLSFDERGLACLTVHCRG
eukprot:s2587_g6.t1